MTEKAFPRAKFDQRRSYVTLREFRLSGQMIAVGQLFDKALVDTRKLRQLYDARYLRMATTAEEPTSSRSRPRLREAAA